jgi:hypothetical protein
MPSTAPALLISSAGASLLPPLPLSALLCLLLVLAGGDNVPHEPQEGSQDDVEYGADADDWTDKDAKKWDADNEAGLDGRGGKSTGVT